MTNINTDLGYRIRLAIREVEDLISETRIPHDVASFSELHNYIDANELGGMCEDKVFNALWAQFGGAPEGDMPQGMVEYVNKLQGAVDAYLKVRDHLEFIPARIVSQMVRLGWMALDDERVLRPNPDDHERTLPSWEDAVSACVDIASEA